MRKVEITEDDATSLLRQAGLFAHRMTWREHEIIGGTSGEYNADGSLSLTDPFMIYFDETWVVQVSGPGQRTTRIPANTLAESVEIVCNLHKEGKLSPRRPS